MLLRKVIFEEEQGAASGLPEDDVLPAVVGEITDCHGPTVGITVRSRQETDVHKIPAMEVQERSLPLIGAQVVSLWSNFKRIVHPKFIQGRVELARLRNVGASIIRL